MKKTIIALTLLSFAFLSLHVHIHENDQLDPKNTYGKIEYTLLGNGSWRKSRRHASSSMVNCIS